MARGTGSDAQVQSPTFQLVRIYPGRVQLAHVDLYRVKAAGELADLGLDELLDGGAMVIEWGDRLDLRRAELVTFENLGEDRRRLRFETDRASSSSTPPRPCRRSRCCGPTDA